MRLLSSFLLHSDAELPQSCEIYYTSMTGYPFSIAIVVPPSERQVLVVDEEALDKTVIRYISHHYPSNYPNIYILFMSTWYHLTCYWIL